MPRIPIFTAEGNVARYNPPMRSPEAAAAPGRALESVGQGAADIGSAISQIQQRQDEAQRKIEEARNVSDAADRSAYGSRQLSALEEKASKLNKADEARRVYDQGAAAIVADMLTGVDNLQVANVVKQRLESETLIRGQNVSTAAFRNETSTARAENDKQAEQYARDAARAKTPLEAGHAIDTYVGNTNALVHTGLLTPEDGQKRISSFQSDVQVGQVLQGFADARTLAITNPKAGAAAAKAQAEDLAKNPDKYPFITADKYQALREQSAIIAETLQNRVDVVEREKLAELRAKVREDYEDNLASVGATGVYAVPQSHATRVAAYGADQAARMTATLDLAQKSFHARQKIGLASPAEEDAALEAAKPQPGRLAGEQARMYGALVSEVQQKHAALAKDPAAYVLGASPDLGAQFQTAFAAQDGAAMRTVIGAMDAQYEHLGVPPEGRAVLPEGIAKDVTTAILTDPANAPQRFAELQVKYGDNWPRVFHDLTALGKLPPPFQSLAMLVMKDDSGRLIVTREAVNLAHWIADTKGKSAGDILPRDDVNLIDNTVKTSPAVQALTASLVRQGLSNVQAANVIDSIQMLGYAGRFYDGDADAGNHAIEAFTGKFRFMPGNARVPVERYEAVNRAAQLTLDGLNVNNVMVPPLYSGGVPYYGTAPLSKGVLANGMLPDLRGTLDPAKAGDAWTVEQMSVDGIEAQYVLPSQPGDKPASGDGIVLGDAAERFLKTGQYYGAFDDQERAELFMKRAQGLGGVGTGPRPEEYITQLRHAPQWVNNPRSNGLWLMDSQGGYVLDKTGKPIEIPFTANPAPAFPEWNYPGAPGNVLY